MEKSPRDGALICVMEQKAPRSVSWRFTPKSCQLARRFTSGEGSEERVLSFTPTSCQLEEIHESVSDVVVYGMAR